MTKENARHYLPLMYALAQGAIIQDRDTDGQWRDLEQVSWFRPVDEYRIKPDEEPDGKPDAALEEKDRRFYEGGHYPLLSMRGKPVAWENIAPDERLDIRRKRINHEDDCAGDERLRAIRKYLQQGTLSLLNDMRLNQAASELHTDPATKRWHSGVAEGLKAAIDILTTVGAQPTSFHIHT